MTNRNLLIFIFVFQLISCLDNAIHLDSENMKPSEFARNVKMEYRDSVEIQVVIQAPLLERLKENNEDITVFNEGVHVEFYSKGGKIQSWLKADKAIQYTKSGKIVARENVYLYNVQGDTLITSEIIWDEKKSEVRTTKFVKIKRPNNEVINSYGFKADQNFSNFTLFAIEGDVQVKDLDI